ncbi:Chromosome condensation regulator protein, related [Eimeria tenella]|uniref:Chromosome condensation regulator protein, related n=1 Tax=Eimeria tenella TaxID=5802 RepID=U6KWM5_EIMTE|nr:Chromosome condensation regulator protein, related [Eimeria tenella]CDJ42522.1 Chromosome condensation regulator protein, related [Eimeria tenella]|eukprot:XP_013233272.1 Chromosome condensation regulator protein, related [Eimeria tenella]
MTSSAEDIFRNAGSAASSPARLEPSSTATTLAGAKQTLESRRTSESFADILGRVEAPSSLTDKSPVSQNCSSHRAPNKEPFTAAQERGRIQQSSFPCQIPQEGGGPDGDVAAAISKLKRRTLEEKRDISTDTSASPFEFVAGHGSSSLVPEGVCAVGEGTLIQQDSSLLAENDMYEIVAACQKTSDMATAELLRHGGSGSSTSTTRPFTTLASGISEDPWTVPPVANAESAEAGATATAACQVADGCDVGEIWAEANDGDDSQWPFESGLRPWEDIDKETRKAAEGVSSSQLEDHKKIRIWVLHKGVCTPVSWYVDTSAEDVKASVLCACDVLADEGVDPDHPSAEASFCLRPIRPLPDSAEVDGEDLFMEVKTLQMRCQLPSPDCEPEVLAPQPTENAERLLEETSVAIDGAEKSGSEEVSVRVMLGPRVYSKDFPSLKDGATYLLEPRPLGADDPQQKEELAKLRKLTGDKWRRIYVSVDPLRHIEAQKAILRMRRGTNLLKHTRFGHPHLRQFQLSADRQRLLWYSASKGKEASVVQMGELEGLVLGQKSATFQSYRIPAVQHLSFSLVFRGETSRPDFASSVLLPDASIEDARTLDLTCKDEAEFEAWVTGCKAIIAASKHLKLSKLQLLSHSKRFLRALQRSEATVQLTKLPEEKGQSALQDCMDLPWHPLEELERKYEEQKRRIDTAAEEIRALDRTAVVRSNVDLSVLVGAGPAYASVFGDSEQVDDEEMEFERMRELLFEVTQVLAKAKAELTEYKKAEEERQQHSREGAAASMDSAVSGPFYPEAAKEDPSSKGSLDHKPAGGSCDSSDSLVKSSVLAISSGGEVLMRSGAAGLTFEERFKMAATVNSVGLEVVQEQVKEGIVTLLQRAANQTAEAQQIFTSALAAAAAVVGVDSPHQSGPPDTLPVEDVEKLKSINQLLWRAEVDVENVEDMLARLKAPSTLGGMALAGTVASLNHMVTTQLSTWGGQLASMVTDFLMKAEVPQLGLPAPAGTQRPPIAYSDSDYEDEFS